MQNENVDMQGNYFHMQLIYEYLHAKLIYVRSSYLCYYVRFLC